METIEIGVRNDIATCLKYKPKKRPTFILMHDSSNPTVRKAIAESPWAEHPHVHGVGLDFIPGVLFDRGDLRGQIWGGLAAAVMLPEKRSGELSLEAPFE
ncbi:hypothetical protein, partial [Bradyrhizobium liaoningense]